MFNKIYHYIIHKLNLCMCKGGYTGRKIRTREYLKEHTKKELGDKIYTR